MNRLGRTERLVLTTLWLTLRRLQRLGNYWCDTRLRAKCKEAIQIGSTNAVGRTGDLNKISAVEVNELLDTGQVILEALKVGSFEKKFKMG